MGTSHAGPRSSLPFYGSFDEGVLKSRSRHRLVRIVQAQFQQLAFSKQLTDALVHDSAQMGDVAEGWLSQLVDLPRALAAYVALVPPRWVCAPADAALGCVPAARVMVEYVRFRLSRRQSHPTGLPVYLATPVTSLRQLTLLLNLDLPRIFPRLSADVYLDYGILSAVVARWSLALGVEMFLPPPTREVGVRDDTDGSSPEDLRRDDTRWLYFADFYGRNVSIVIDVAPLTELAAALLRLCKSIDLDMVGMRGWPFQGNPFVHEEMAPLSRRLFGCWTPAD